MENRKKRYFYPLILTIVSFLILYIGFYFYNPSTSLQNAPISFQILFWILIYFFWIAFAIKLGLFGWNE